MSRPHDGQRPFFPFGNPFRSIFPKGSYSSPRLLGLLNSFEDTLAERLKKLKPKGRMEVLSISWMRLAMELLSETHRDIKTLITELQFPVNYWDGTWMDLYLDNSIKLLDICIAFNSEMSRLNQAQLMLKCALHVLNTPNSSPSQEQLFRARTSLNVWMQQINLGNPKLENSLAILEGLVGSLNLTDTKNSSKGRVLMRAMYGVRITTIFICSIFMAAFSRSSKPLMNFHISDKYLWESAFNELQNDVNAEFRGVTLLKELEAVEVRVKKLCGTSGEGMEAEMTHNLILDLGKNAEALSQGLDVLSREIEGFFQIVLNGRDALLCNLRVSCSDSNIRKENIVEEKVVR